MSSNEELVLRAEQAAQQIAQDKAEIQRIEAKFDEVQAPAIAEAKENIRQAINEKGQVVDETVPFSEYAEKIRKLDVIPPGVNVGYPSLKEEDVKYGVNFTDGSTSKHGTFTADATAEASDITQGKIAYVRGEKVIGTATGETGPRILISNDERWRWFDIDCIETIHSVQSPTYCGNILVINGKAFSVFGPADYSGKEYACIPVSVRDDLLSVYYREDYRYLFLSKTGDLYGAEGVYFSDVTLPLTLKPITTGVDDVCPSNDGRYWVRKGNTVELWVDYTLKGSTDSIERFVSTKAEPGSYGHGHGLLAVTTSGELCTIYSTEGDNIQKQVVSPASPTGAWRDFCFYGYESLEGGGCYGFATDTEGNLYYAEINAYDLNSLYSLSFTKVEGISGVKMKPGYCVTDVYMNWNEETYEETYTPHVSTAALVIDGEGRLWKLTAAIESGGTELAGIVKEQVGTDEDWAWCESQINRKGVSLMQKGARLLRYYASDTNELSLTYGEVKTISGTVDNIFSPSSGDWCIVVSNDTATGSGGLS